MVVVNYCQGLLVRILATIGRFQVIYGIMFYNFVLSVNIILNSWFVIKVPLDCYILLLLIVIATLQYIFPHFRQWHVVGLKKMLGFYLIGFVLAFIVFLCHFHFNCLFLLNNPMLNYQLTFLNTLFSYSLYDNSVRFFIYIVGILILFLMYHSSAVILVFNSYAHFFLFLLLFFLSILSFFGTFLVNNFFLLFLFFELNSFLLILVITLFMPTVKALRSGIMYFYISLLATIFYLVGCVFLLFVDSDTSYFYLKKIVIDIVTLDLFVTSLSATSIYYFIGGFFILTSLLLKLGMFPFFFWLPTVYKGVSYFILIYLVIYVKTVHFLLFFKLYFQFFYMFTFFSVYIGVIGMGSVLFGVIYLLHERTVRGFIAYSSLVNMGLLFLVLSSNWTSSNISLFNIIIYLLIYNFSLLLFLLVLLNIRIYRKKNYREVIYLTELTGLFFNAEGYCLCLTIALFSFMGLPPFAGFIIKFGLLKILIISQNYGFFLLFLIINLISSFYYLRIIKLLYFNWEISIFKYSLTVNALLYALCIVLGFILFFYLGIVILSSVEFSKFFDLSLILTIINIV